MNWRQHAANQLDRWISQCVDQLDEHEQHAAWPKPWVEHPHPFKDEARPQHIGVNLDRQLEDKQDDVENGSHLRRGADEE